ncbi:MAG: hypothetical protein ACYDAL_04205 [Candidatus Dormibacteraceae bacterium]
MAVPRAIQNLFTWKVAFLQGQINDINAHIRRNNAAIRRLRRMPDTEQQIESLEHQNDGLEETKKGLEDELERFNRGSEGKKINMARRNIGNEIHRLQLEALEKNAAAAAALRQAAGLIDTVNAANEALK